MRPVFPTLQTLCPGYETVFLYWILSSPSFGYGLFVHILMGQYPFLCMVEIHGLSVFTVLLYTLSVHLTISGNPMAL
jgi:hypothetical protein